MDKKHCQICNRDVSFFSRRKLLDGYVCDECYKEANGSRFIDIDRLSIDQFKILLKYKTERTKLLNQFIPTIRVIGDDNSILIDESQGTFVIIRTPSSWHVYEKTARIRNNHNDSSDTTTAPHNTVGWNYGESFDLGGDETFIRKRINKRKAWGSIKFRNIFPDIFYLREVKNYSPYITKNRYEIARITTVTTYDEGCFNEEIDYSTRYSYTPRCFAINYIFEFDILLNNPFVTKIHCNINNPNEYLYRGQEDTIYASKTSIVFKRIQSYKPYNGKTDNDETVRASEEYKMHLNYLAILDKAFALPKQPEPINFCGQCGTKLTGDKRFCPQCGTKV